MSLVCPTNVRQLGDIFSKRPVKGSTCLGMKAFLMCWKILQVIEKWGRLKLGLKLLLCGWLSLYASFRIPRAITITSGVIKQIHFRGQAKREWFDSTYLTGMLESVFYSTNSLLSSISFCWVRPRWADDVDFYSSNQRRPKMQRKAIFRLVRVSLEIGADLESLAFIFSTLLRRK